MSGRKDRENRRRERLVVEERAQGEGRRKKLLQLASAAAFLAIAAVVVLIVVNSSGSDGGNADQLDGVAEINRELDGIPQSGMALGDRNAPVRLIEFGDLKCPVCASFSKEVVPEVIDSRVRGGRAQIEFRNFTIIDDQSETAGAAALAAGAQGRGWNFLEIFYRNQGVETDAYADDEFLTAVARAAGVADIGRWNRARESTRTLARVRRTSAEASQLGFSGTPSFAVEAPSGRLEPLGTPGSAGELEAAIDSASQS
jgi:protein-disulfide isomerase